jgi:hypothetical protein
MEITHSIVKMFPFYSANAIEHELGDHSILGMEVSAVAK